MWYVRIAALGGLVLVMAGCAAGLAGRTGRVDRNSITLEEIRTSNYADAYDLVRGLRPQWLGTRGSGSLQRAGEVKVYLDGLLLGGPEYLRQITRDAIRELRFHDAIDATQRWGTDHALGAITVSTR